jgi:hypothetical protein
MAMSKNTKRRRYYPGGPVLPAASPKPASGTWTRAAYNNSKPKKEASLPSPFLKGSQAEAAYKKSQQSLARPENRGDIKR